LEQAQATGEIAATAPITLFNSGERGLLLVAPISQAGDAAWAAPPQSGLEGYMVGSFHLDALLAPVLTSPEHTQLAAYLFDVSDPTQPQLLLAHTSGDGGGMDAAKSWTPAALQSGRFAATRLEMAGRQWLLIVRPTPAYALTLRTWTPWLTLLAALAFTGVAVGFLTQRQRASEALEHSEENLRRAQALSHTGSWVLDIRTDRLECSEETCRLLGLPAKAAPTVAEMLQIVHPDDFSLIKTAWAGALAGKPFEIEHRILTGGQERWVRHQVTVRLGPDGAPLTSIGAIQDITERRRAADELQSQQLLLQTVIDSTPDWIFIKDWEHRYRLVNQGYAASLRVTPEQAIGKNDLELGFAPANVLGDPAAGIRGFWADDREVLEGGEARLLPAEPALLYGQQMYLRTIKAPIRTPDGAVWGVLGYAHDITERERLVETLRRHSEEMSLLLEASRELSSTLDLHTVYTIVHRTIRQWAPCDSVIISSYDPASQLIRCVYYGDDAGEKDVSTFPPIPLEAEGQGTQSLVIRSGQSLLLADYEAQRATAATAYFVDEQGEIILDIAADAERMRSAILVPLSVDGEVAGVVQVFSYQVNAHTEDHLRFAEALIFRVTGLLSNVRLFQRLQDELAERRRVEAQVRQLNAQLEQRVAERTQDLRIANASLTRALQAKDEFLAIMSHELRTPLTGILALAEMLITELRGPLNVHQRKYVTNIDLSGRHLLSLINDILDLSKVEAGRLELQIKVVSVSKVCQASLRMIREIADRKGLHVSYHCSDASLRVLADEIRLKQILVNLLSNAVKFTAAGGSVALMVEADDANKLMRFAVQDTGIGIAAADTERIFQPFTQLDSSLARQHEGTGLGLTLVKRLAELHGGAVSVASEGVAGKGSRFTITLPWRTAEAPSSLPVDATTPARAALPRRPVVLLLMGDNDLDMQPLFDHLHGLGYQLATARTVAEALEQAQLTVPDIALINIHTPPNDDLEAIRRLRALSGLAKTPIIALGASATAENQMHCLEAGADDFMRQPFTPQRLAARMEQFLLRPRSVQP
jgi:PAS domain S-box-containing protein